MLQSRWIFPVAAELELKLSLPRPWFLQNNMYYIKIKRQSCIVLASDSPFTGFATSLKDSKITLDPVIFGLHSFVYFTSCFSFLYEKESPMQILAAKKTSKRTELKTLSKGTKRKQKSFQSLHHLTPNSGPKSISNFIELSQNTS